MFAELPLDDWHRVIEVNLTGTYLAMRSAVEPMRARGGGAIVTIASVASKQPEAGPVAYSVSKVGRLDADEAGCTRARRHRASA